MLSLPPSVRLFVATQPVDGRKGADRLMVIVRDVFKQDHSASTCSSSSPSAATVCGSWYWNRNGVAMLTKRLEAGRYRPTFSSDGKLASLATESAELALIVEGIDLAGARRRRRWQPGTALGTSSSAPPIP